MSDRGVEPPESLSAAVIDFDRTVRENGPSWFTSQGLIADLDRWQRLARDAGSFWGFADDYLNELGSRERLVLWMDRANGAVRRWLVGEVDRIDDEFRSMSVQRSPDALPDEAVEPAAWWRRRLPADRELADALERIQSG